MGKYFETFAHAELYPRFIQLGPNLYGVCFFLMKLIPAKFILDRARATGLLKSGVVIETTSGTFGLALAILCSQMGLRFIMVSDPAIQPELRSRLEDLGVEVVIVDKPAAVGGYQAARLERLQALLEANPGSFCPQQYENPCNPDSYGLLAEQIVDTLGRVDCLVGAVGSGGSMSGTSKFLRGMFPLSVVGVDTLGSMIFGQPDQKRLLRGLGNSLMPNNVDHRVFNEIHWVSAAEAFRATRVLHTSKQLFRGPTSGAAWYVARWWAAQNPDKKTVVIMADEGHRYVHECYSDPWLRENNVWLDTLPDSPKLVNHPRDARDTWSRFRWDRRTYREIMEQD